MTHKRMITFIMLLLLALTSAWVAGQDNTIQMGDVTVSGDTNSEALQVVQNYLQSRDVNLLAEDVQFHDQTYIDPLSGRDTVTQLENDFFTQAFTDITIDPIHFVVAEDLVVAEYQFQGTNTGAYRGVPATNAPVVFPVVSIFEVQNGQITSVDRYYDASSVGNQLGYAPYYGPGYIPPAAPVAPVVTEDTISNVADFPGQFYNENVTIEGRLGEGVGERGFILYERDLVGTDDVLVIDRSENRPQFIQLADARVQVSGTVQQYDLASIESELGFDLDDALYNDLTNRYGLNMPVLLADSIVNLEHESYIQNLIDNPEAFYGKQVWFGGRAGEVLGNQAAYVYEDALVDADYILVVGSSADLYDFASASDQMVEIQGTVRNFVLTDLESEYGFDLEDNAFADYQGPVVVADSITPMNP